MQTHTRFTADPPHPPPSCSLLPSPDVSVSSPPAFTVHSLRGRQHLQKAARLPETRWVTVRSTPLKTTRLCLARSKNKTVQLLLLLRLLLIFLPLTSFPGSRVCFPLKIAGGGRARMYGDWSSDVSAAAAELPLKKKPVFESSKRGRHHQISDHVLK